jgi:hypothetical protein
MRLLAITVMSTRCRAFSIRLRTDAQLPRVSPAIPEEIDCKCCRSRAGSSREIFRCTMARPRERIDSADL